MATSTELQRAFDVMRMQNRIFATAVVWLILTIIVLKIAANSSDKSKTLMMLGLIILPIILWYISGLIIPKKIATT